MQNAHWPLVGHHATFDEVDNLRPMRSNGITDQQHYFIKCGMNSVFLHLAQVANAISPSFHFLWLCNRAMVGMESKQTINILSIKRVGV